MKVSLFLILCIGKTPINYLKFKTLNFYTITNFHHNTHVLPFELAIQVILLVLTSKFFNKIKLLKFFRNFSYFEIVSQQIEFSYFEIVT